MNKLNVAKLSKSLINLDTIKRVTLNPKKRLSPKQFKVMNKYTTMIRLFEKRAVTLSIELNQVNEKYNTLYKEMLICQKQLSKIKTPVTWNEAMEII